MSDQITHLPLQMLAESPFNPRKHFAAGAMAELADSIRAQGVLQPIVVRPLVDLATDDDYTRPRYEIVFGHRRARAAEAAGLEQVPCIVRAMTDQDAAISQVHENSQRQDVTALEEAEGFVRLQQDHGMSADAIAEAIGKSRSHVYGRLKLASACYAVHDAVLNEGLAPEIALEVARLRGFKLQQAALDRLRRSMYGNEGWPSVRPAREMIRRLFECRLGHAEFDGTVPLADRAACSNCPKLAANDPDLAELDADVCTDPDCFEAKSKAHCAACVAALRGAGATVLDGKAAEAIMRGSRYMVGYEAAGSMTLDTGDPKAEPVTLRQVAQTLRAAGIEVPPSVHIVRPDHTVVEAYADDDIDTITQAWRVHQGIDARERKASPAPSSGRHEDDEDPADRMADWTPAERATMDEDVWTDVRRAVLSRVVRATRTADELRLALLREYEMSDDPWLDDGVLRDIGLTITHEALQDADYPRELVRAELQRMTPDQLSAVLIAIVIDDQLGRVPRYFGNLPRSTAAERVALAQRYGVDPAEHLAPPPEAAAKPDPYAPAALIGKGIRYRDPLTGDTWTGRGLQPAWLKAQMAKGKRLADFDIANQVEEAAA